MEFGKNEKNKGHINDQKVNLWGPPKRPKATISNRLASVLLSLLSLSGLSNKICSMTANFDSIKETRNFARSERFAVPED